MSEYRCVKPSCALECDGFSCPACGSDTTRKLKALPPQDWAEFQKLAAQQARACEIIMAADALAEQLQRYWTAATTPSRTLHPDYDIQKVIDLLDAYKIARQGT